MWLLVLAARLWTVDPQLWRHRDDAVITLSHARGLVELGVVSVSAVPERVEGFSTPLQFLLALPYYTAGGRSWALLLDAQVVASTVLAGFFTARILEQLTGLRGVRLVMVTAMTGAVALWPFTVVGWFASGMDNSLVAVALLASASTLLALSRGTGGPWAVGCALAILGVARAELVLFAAPLVLLGMWLGRPTLGRRAVLVGVVPALTWVVVETARLLYFRSLVPNSGTVQGKGTVDDAVRWLAVLGLTAALTLVARRIPVLRTIRQGFDSLVLGRLWDLLVVSTSLLIAASAGVVLGTEPSSFGVIWSALFSPSSGATLLLLVVAAGWLLGSTPPPRQLSIMVAVTAIPLLQLAWFGRARLDDLRISQLLFFPLAPLAVATALGLLRRSGVVERYPALARTALPAGMVAIPALMLWAAHVPVVGRAAAATDLCCGISPVDQEILTTARTAKAAHRLPGVITANPDLGKLSHEKEAIVVDLGLLGSPLLALADQIGPSTRDDLVLDVLLPDVLEVHGYWTCVYRSLLDDPRFEASYVMTSPGPGEVSPRGTCTGEDPVTIYVRRDGPAYRQEAELSRGLAVEQGPGARVDEALDSCLGAGTAWNRCEWVRRAVLRAMPELDADERSQVASALERSPSSELDLVLLFRSDTAGWQASAMDRFLGLSRECSTPGPC